MKPKKKAPPAKKSDKRKAKVGEATISNDLATPSRTRAVFFFLPSRCHGWNVPRARAWMKTAPYCVCRARVGLRAGIRLGRWPPRACLTAPTRPLWGSALHAPVLIFWQRTDA